MTGKADVHTLGWLGAGRTGAAMVRRLPGAALCPGPSSSVAAASAAEFSIRPQPSGFAREAFPACLNKSVAGPPFTHDKTPAYVSRDVDPTVRSKLLRKDFGLGLAAARERAVPGPTAALVQQIVQSLVGRGYGDVDFAAFIAQQAESAGITLESEHADVSDGLDSEDS